MTIINNVKETRQLIYIKSPQIPDATEPNHPVTLSQLQSSARRYTVSIGDGVNSTIQITHGLNNLDIFVIVREANTPFTQILPSNYMDAPNLTIIDSNNVSIKFINEVPSLNKYKMTIIG